MNINSAFPSNYIKASDLMGKAVQVVIKDVKVEQIGRDKDAKPVVYFQGKDKGLVLNKTNARKIADISGSQDTDDWAGTSILIYPTETEFAGESVECVRVKAPTQQRRQVEQPVAPIPSDDDIPF